MELTLIGLFGTSAMEMSAQVRQHVSQTSSNYATRSNLVLAARNDDGTMEYVPPVLRNNVYSPFAVMLILLAEECERGVYPASGTSPNHPNHMWLSNESSRSSKSDFNLIRATKDRESTHHASIIFNLIFKYSRAFNQMHRS